MVTGSGERRGLQQDRRSLLPERQDHSTVSNLPVYRVIDPESLLGSNPMPFLPSMAVAGSLPTKTTQNLLDT